MGTETKRICVMLVDLVHLANRYFLQLFSHLIMPIKMYFTSFCYFHCSFFCSVVHHLLFNNIRAAPLQRLSTVITRPFAVIMLGSTLLTNEHFQKYTFLFFYLKRAAPHIMQKHSWIKQTCNNTRTHLYWCRMRETRIA